MEEQIENQKVVRPKRRGSLFWPMLLIALGIVFLLDNVGVLSGDTWGSMLRYWPVLFIVGGLDGIYRREGLVGSTFIIGLGVIFLLANLGYLAVSVWRMVIYLWPVLLIAIGFDIMIGRRSMVASLIGLTLILAILAGSLWLFGVRVDRGQGLAGEGVYQALGSASSARIVIEPGAGDLHIEAADQAGALVEGSVFRPGGMEVTEESSQSDGKTTYTLRSVGSTAFIPTSFDEKWSWDIGLTTEIPLDLRVAIGAGRVTLDLANLKLSDLRVEMGVGATTITLPEEGSYKASIDGAIGQMTLVVPKGVGVRVQSDTAIVGVSVPSSFIKRDGVYYSPNYNSAAYKVDIQWDLAIGALSITQ